MKLSGWGRYPLIETNIKSPNTIEEIIQEISIDNAIARGNGRSYGDSAINKKNTIDMRRFNRMLDFNDQTGLLVVESGMLLSEIIEIFLPRGWFPKVTPGSKFVTVGGMVACDVHGKNHQKDGSFSNYIEWLKIITPSGEIKRCSKEVDSELFNWTIGGMGLTGIILDVAFYLNSVETAWIKQKTVATKNLEQTFKIFEETLDKTYSVAWLDSMAKGKNLGKSLIMLGEHAKVTDLPKNIKKNPFKIKKKRGFKFPFNLPSFFLNSLTVKFFNKIYYSLGANKKNYKLVDYDTYFYPLDYIRDWHKIYGKKGFAQFQCVLPLKDSFDGIHELLKFILKTGTGSFLTVLKRFGKQESLISFPMEGYTLTLDLPITKKNMEVMKELDAITIKYKGRFYLAKDSRMTEQTLKKSDPRFTKYNEFRKSKSGFTFKSVQSERLGL